MAKQNHRGFFQLLQSKIRAESTRCCAGNLNLLLTQNLAEANHNASDLLKGPEQGSVLVCRFLYICWYSSFLSCFLPERGPLPWQGRHHPSSSCQTTIFI